MPSGVHAMDVSDAPAAAPPVSERVPADKHTPTTSRDGSVKPPGGDAPFARRNPTSPLRRACLSKDQFISEHLHPAVPVVLDGHAREWPAFERWDFEYLEKAAGSDRVLLMLDGDRSEGTRREATVGEFIRSFRSKTHTHRAQHQRTGEAEADSAADGARVAPVPTSALTSGVPTSGVPYLREWAFAKRHPDLLDDVSPAQVYFEDGFKRFDADERPALIWLFVGPKGTYTPLHRDLWHTDAWIAQLRGKKLVRLWHPRHVETLSRGDRFVDLSSPDLSAFPRCHEPECVEGVLSPGDVLYVPSDWLHEVIALEDSISVSENFMSSSAREALVRPLHSDWLARRSVSREIDAVTKRLRMVASLEALRDGDDEDDEDDDEEEEDEDGRKEGKGSAAGRRGFALSKAQLAVLDEKPTLQARLARLRAMPSLGAWRPTTL